MPHYLELDVSLAHIKPRLWRRFLLHEDATFHDLHAAIQDAFGWENAHLFEFRTQGRSGRRVAELDDAEEIPLSTVLGAGKRKTKNIVYVYDFGDSWEHNIKLVKRLELDEQFFRRLTGGARSGPLEDCGGIHGYERMVKLCKTGKDPWGSGDVDDVLEWMGGWEPESFELNQASKRFDIKVAPEALSTILPDDAPAKVRDVLKLLRREMKKRQWPGDIIEEAEQLWITYYNLDRPSVRKSAIYAASVEYCVGLYHSQDFSQSDLARSYKTSAASISQKYRAIFDAYRFLGPASQSAGPGEGLMHMLQGLGGGNLDEMIQNLESVLGPMPEDMRKLLDMKNPMELMAALQDSTEMFEDDDEEPSEPLPKNAHTWPALYCMVPDETIWKATGCGSVIIAREDPDGLCSVLAVQLDLCEQGIFDVMLLAPMPRSKANSIFQDGLEKHVPPFQPGDEELAARYLWGAYALNPIELDPMTKGAFGLFAVPKGPQWRWKKDFIKSFVPADLKEAIGDSTRTADMLPTQSFAIFTDATFRIKDPSEMLAYFVKEDEAFIDAGEDDERGHCFDWVRPYPENHWSPLASLGGLQIIGSVSIKGDKLTAHGKNLSMLSILLHLLRDAQKEPWTLEDVVWMNPANGLN